MRTATILLTGLMTLSLPAWVGAQDRLTTEQVELHRACGAESIELASWCVEKSLEHAARDYFELAVSWDPELSDHELANQIVDPANDREHSTRALRRKETKFRDTMASLLTRFARFAQEQNDREKAELYALKAIEYNLNQDGLELCLSDEQKELLRCRRLADEFRYDESALTRMARKSGKITRLKFLIAKFLPEAIRNAEEGLGCRLPSNHGIKVTFSAVDPERAPAHAVVWLEDGKIEIKFFIRKFESEMPEYRVRRLVRHEMIHVLQLLAMGKRAYLRQPYWFREGLAVFLARQGPERLEWALREVDWKLEKLLDGLEPGATHQHCPEDYAEAWMALQFLQEVIGPDGFDDFLRTVISADAPVETALADAAGMHLKDFETTVHAWARKHAVEIAKTVPSPDERNEPASETRRLAPPQQPIYSDRQLGR